MQINNNNAAYESKRILSKSSLSRPLILVIILIFFTGNFLSAQIQTTAIRDLKFGSFAIGLTGGTVVVSNQGDRSVTGTITALPLSEVSAAVIELKVNGKARGDILIGLPGTAQLGHSSGIGSMIITNFTSDKSGTITDIDDGKPRTYTISIGATVMVDAAAPAGEYQGDFPVTFTIHNQ